MKELSYFFCILVIHFLLKLLTYVLTYAIEHRIQDRSDQFERQHGDRGRACAGRLAGPRAGAVVLRDLRQVSLGKSVVFVFAIVALSASVWSQNVNTIVPLVTRQCIVDRQITVLAMRPRWVDMPLSYEESLTTDKKLTLTSKKTTLRV